MRYPVWGVTRDQNGLVIASAAIDVYLAGSTTAAEVYLAQVGGVPVSTVTSGINGYFVFYVDAAKSAMQGYKLDIKKAGYSAYVIDNVFPAFTDYWVDARAISDNVYTSDDIVVTLEAIGTVNKSTILLKPGIWQLNDDLEIPANVALKMPFGAVIELGPYNLTINGPIIAEDDQQIFDISSTGVVIFTLVKRQPARWFGAASPFSIEEVWNTDPQTEKYAGFARDGVAGTSLTFGDLCYLSPVDSKWEKADANAASAAEGDARGILGMCVRTAAEDAPTKILLYGIIRADAVHPAFTINAPVYAGETPGTVVVAQPTPTDVVIRVVGFGWTADELFFCPSPMFITHV